MRFYKNHTKESRKCFTPDFMSIILFLITQMSHFVLSNSVSDFKLFSIALTETMSTFNFKRLFYGERFRFRIYIII